MRILLSGQKYFGRAVADLLQELGCTLAGISAPTGDSLADLAAQRKIPLIAAGRLSPQIVDQMCPDLDLIVCAHSHDFISSRVRDRARLGAIGYHPSLLPLYRGRSAIEWQLRFGERITGGTLYWLSNTVDGGPIAAQRFAHVPPKSTASTLWRDILQPIGLELFAELIPRLRLGEIPSEEQDRRLATWHPSLDNVPPLHRPDLPQLPAPGQVFRPVCDVHKTFASNHA